MSERHLSVQIQKDSIAPDLSPECAIAGLEIVRDFVPWIRLEKESRMPRLGRDDRDFVVTDLLRWSKQDADINIVLTRRTLVESTDLQPYGNYNLKKIAPEDESIGWAYHMSRVNSKRIAIVNTSAIKRPEHIVAHEVGHLLGVRLREDNAHCDDKKCLMYPSQYVHGRADRTFCDCCSEQLYDNSQKLRQAKTGKFGFARNAKIF